MDEQVREKELGEQAIKEASKHASEQETRADLRDSYGRYFSFFISQARHSF